LNSFIPYLGFILLPVAAASGWWFARQGGTQRSDQRCSTLSTDYFRGLNYLINQEQDRAIDLFTRLVEEEPEMVETHLALGTLFRRQGDTSQAIQLHNNLVSSGNLTTKQRSHALLELGLDYMKAGLLDRAEEPLQDLLQLGVYQEEAYSQLVIIYQQEREWDRAIEMLRKQIDGSGKNRVNVSEKNSPVIAQFICEQAELAKDQEDIDEALKLVKSALNEDPKAVRATILQAELLLLQGDRAGAIVSYKMVEEQNSSFIPNIITPLIKIYRQEGDEAEVYSYLNRLLQEYPSTTVLLATVEQIQLMHGEKVAEQFLIKQLMQRPSVRGLERLIKLNLAHAQDEKSKQGLLGLQMLTSQLQEEKPEYLCGQCGFQAIIYIGSVQGVKLGTVLSLF